MEGRVVLCIDELSCQDPGLIGLEGEAFESQPWLGVYSSGRDARQAAAEAAFTEAWVVSCEDVEPINLAATIKSDCPDLHVCLIASEPCGSLLSRAHTAEIDEVLEQGAFLRRYADVKRRFLDVPAAGDLALQLPAAPAQDTAPAPVPVAVAPATAFEAVTAAPGLAPVASPVPGPPVISPRFSRFAQFQPQPGAAGVSSGSRASVITVVSGSGGTGKSTVSALGALIARARGHSTLLLDYDLQFGDVAGMVGVEDPLRVDVALAHPEQLERELVRDDRLAVLAAPERLEAAEEVVAGLPALLETLEEMFDVIVVNTGAAWAEQHAALLERSSAALFLMDQRVSSVRACRHALELCARCGIATGPFQFALNRCAKGAPLTSVDVSCALQGAPVFELKDGGRDVEDYLSSGAAAELFEMKGELVKSLEHVMDRLLPSTGVRLVERQQAEAGRRPTRRRGRHGERKRGWK